MPAGQYNITVEQGATFKRTFAWNNHDGSPVSITGCSARMQIREKVDSSTALITISTGSEGGISMVEPNLIEVEITPTQTSSLKFEKGSYDLKLTQPDGTVVRLIEGRVNLSLAVTR